MTTKTDAVPSAAELPPLPKPCQKGWIFDHSQMRAYALEAIAAWNRRAPAEVQAEAVQVDEPVEQFLSEVRAELMCARSKFPGDRIMTIALAEEFGELCKAVLDESAANVRKEAVQTAVMCARVVLDGDGSVIAWRAERGLDALAAPAASGGERES